MTEELARRVLEGDHHWFDRARFGLFVHWGLYSAKGFEPSWPLVGGSPAFPYGQDVTPEAYYADAERWVPPPGAPREWVQMAKAAGMTYAVLTTKHHDGFALFDSEHSDFSIARNAPGRDLVREFVDACHDQGLRVGLYYSLSDWHHRDYPAYSGEWRPYPFLAYPRPDADTWERFLADQRGQLGDLLTNYGQIDLLWFDGGWERKEDEWRSTELEAFIRARQPGIVINDRLPGVGDYESPEQSLPTRAIDGWWETCLTMNHSWGPVAADLERKSVRNLLWLLGDVAGGGGNLLLNISPDGDGHVLDWQRERIEALGGWLARHADAVVGTEPALAPGQFYGPTTQRVTDDAVITYLLCPMRPVELVTVRSIHGGRIESVRALGSDTPLAFDVRLSAIDRVFLKDPRSDVVISVPDDATDELMTVIEITQRPGPA